MTQQQTEAFERRENRLMSGVEALQQAGATIDKEVGVVAASKEWAGAEDSEEEMERHATETFQRRERRLTFSAEVLERETAMGDKEVAVVTGEKEWAGAEESDDEGAPMTQRQSEAFERREQRLMSGVEGWQKGGVAMDMEVGIVVEAGEWANAQDSDEEVAVHEASVHGRRERRLTIGAEQLEQQTHVVDMEVDVVTAAEDWKSCEESDGEDMQRHYSQAFDRRERRLTSCADAHANGEVA